MSEPEVAPPEIARRCSACGVSLRQRALYCPQCGAKIGESSGLTAVADNVREVAGNVRERVEKIRHVSHVVIDQAAYDPSLRFLLIAAVFFLLFLVLLIFSKVIG